MWREVFQELCTFESIDSLRVVYVQNTFELADGFHTFAVHPQVEEADVFFNDGSWILIKHTAYLYGKAPANIALTTPSGEWIPPEAA